MRKEKLVELDNLIKEFETINKKELDISPEFIKSKVYECSLNNGKIITREKMLKRASNGKYTDGSAAIVLPITKEKNVILTVEPRVFSKRTVGIGIPAGYIEKGEEAYLAALRELGEETGYVPEKLISLGGFYQDMGCSSAYNELFLAMNCEKKKDQHLDDGEYIKYFDCTFDEALELIDLGYIEGCNAIITLQRVKKYIKKGR